MKAAVAFLAVLASAHEGHADGGSTLIAPPEHDDDYFSPVISTPVLAHAVVGTLLCFVAFPLGTAMVRGDATPAHKLVNTLNSVVFFILSVATRATFSDGESGHATLGRWLTALIVLQVVYAAGRQCLGLREVLPLLPHRALGFLIVVALMPLQWLLGIYHISDMCEQNPGACTAHTLTWLLMFLVALLWFFEAGGRALAARVEAASMLLGGAGALVGLMAVAKHTGTGEEAHLASDWAPGIWQGIGSALAWAATGLLGLVQLKTTPGDAARGTAVAVGLAAHALIVFQGPFYNDVAEVLTRAHAALALVAAACRLAGRLHAAGAAMLLVATLWLAGSPNFAWYVEHALGLPAAAWLGVVVAGVALLLALLVVVRSMVGVSGSSSSSSSSASVKYAPVAAAESGSESDDDQDAPGRAIGDDRL